MCGLPAAGDGLPPALFPTKAMETRTKPAVLAAYRVRAAHPGACDTLIAWCEHCRRWHGHGGGYGFGAGDGHRVAHCKPYTGHHRTGGYVLREVAPVPAWVRRDRGRAKPRGPK